MFESSGASAGWKPAIQQVGNLSYYRAATQTDLTTEDTECSRRRNGSFFISVSSVSSVVNSQLDDDKQVVLDWDQFSGFVVRD